MRYHVLASDYDGTLAHEGKVDADVLAALQRTRASGRKLLLVTGREIEDLLGVFPDVATFDLVVAENGAVIYNPATRAIRLLADPPPPSFAALLRQRGVQPLSVGRVIVATWRPHEVETLEAIRTLGLELQVIFNKGAVMVLPSGINKAVGLAAALTELGLSPHNTVGVGDAENDHAFLSACECAVAVANALPMLKARADLVTVGERGAGVRELCDALTDSDLDALAPRLERHELTLGRALGDDAPVQVPAYGPPVLIAGTSGSGKSTLATAFIEGLTRAGYQYCVVDPEGDYTALEGATVMGTQEHPPSAEALVEVLAKPKQDVVANLTAIPVAERPAFFDTLLSRLLDLRAHTGRPHWIIVDETHHLLPREWRPAAVTIPQRLQNLLLVTVHPEHVSPIILRAVQLAVVVGTEPARTLGAFAGAVGARPPLVEQAGLRADLPAGEGLAWRRGGDGAAPIRFAIDQPRGERRRHVRKYAAGELGPDKSFYFRGPTNQLNLRAHNLQLFLQVADGVDDATWLHHLQRGDYSTWFRDAIKDPELADETTAIEADEHRDPIASRARIREAVEKRYTAPA